MRSKEIVTAAPRQGGFCVCRFVVLENDVCQVGLSVKHLFFAYNVETCIEAAGVALAVDGHRQQSDSLNVGAFRADVALRAGGS